jgi:hypothetical protein
MLWEHSHSPWERSQTSGKRSSPPGPGLSETEKKGKGVAPDRRVLYNPPSARRQSSRAAIAQLDRATDYGSVGWGFDSSWLHQLPQPEQLSSVGPPSWRYGTVPRYRVLHRLAVRFDDVPDSLDHVPQGSRIEHTDRAGVQIELHLVD